MRVWFGLTWLVVVSAAWAQKPIVFAPLPMQKPEDVVAQVKPMLKYLEQAAGVEIHIRYFKTNQEVTSAFARGEVDLTYLGPLPYVSLRQHYSQAEPLVHFKEADGKASYSCALLTLNEHALSQRPLTVALTQPLSTCGYLSVASLLKKQGIDIASQHYRYVGAHDKAVQAVARGEFDLAGAKTTIAQKYQSLGVKVIDETPPLPAFALVANQATLPKEVSMRIRHALELLDLNKDAQSLAGWGDNIRNGVVEAKDSDYDAVRVLMLGGNIPEKGNF